MPSEADDSPGLPPSGVTVQSEADAELAAVLSLATTSIRLEWTPLPCPKCSRLDYWFQPIIQP